MVKQLDSLIGINHLPLGLSGKRLLGSLLLLSFDLLIGLRRWSEKDLTPRYAQNET